MAERQGDYDVAVLGAGAAGLAAAIFAGLDGHRVLLVESTDYIGGTSALSAATLWIPNTRLSDTVGSEDTPERAALYLDNAIGNRAPKPLRSAFLKAGPEAVHRLLDETCVRLRARPLHPDYLYELEGSTARGRALEPEPFDGSVLGKDIALIRPPIPEFTILGGLQVDRDDVGHLLNMGRSIRSLGYSARLLGRYAIDRLRFGRSARLVMGRALIGRLLKAAKDAGVEIRIRTRVTDIRPEGGRTTLVLEREGATEDLSIGGGVILASGGFARHPERRAKMLPRPTPEHSPSAPGHTGALHDIALRLGARYGEGAAQHIFMAPVSRRRRADGTMAVFPHFVFDRAKPGIIAVGADGRRFTNETRSYHEFAGAQFATGTIPAFLVTDATGLRKYGMGLIRPGGHGLKPYLRDGYLVRAESVEALARQLGVDAGGLSDTVARLAEFARSGTDADFHRGETVYERVNGDDAVGPNPTLGPIETPPFYAIRLWPADIGSATGLVTDEHARVLDGSGEPIEGLYACGNDMHSIMGGVYPGPGITIGPGITFGYIAAKHAGGRAG